MLKRIAELERQARQLDPDAGLRREWMRLAQEYSEAFFERLPQTPTYTPDEGRSGFIAPYFGDAPSEMESVLAEFRREADTTGILPSSGGQMGYIPGGGVFPSALGDYLAGISNRYSGVAFAGPGAAAMEGALLRWMSDLVGYPDTAAGDLASGGSLATLSAVVAARDARLDDPAQAAECCVYLGELTHHCVAAALRVSGMGRVRQRLVPMDDRYRLIPEALEAAMREDREAGLLPWLVVASAGTTDTGSIDPINPIADIAERHGAWFHLDAAYGGFFRLCEEASERLAGMSRADSIVMDPHKGLGMPYGSGAVLVRDGRHLLEPNSYYADYMQDAKSAERKADEPYSPADYSPELTRPFRGPRMWFALKLFGLAAYRAALAEKIWLARYFHYRLNELDGFETGPEPDLSIVTFRYLPPTGDVEQFNQALLQRVHDDGRVFITSTRLGGRFTLRLAVLNFRTHRAQVDYLLDLLEKSVLELLQA